MAQGAWTGVSHRRLAADFPGRRYHRLLQEAERWAQAEVRAGTHFLPAVQGPKNARVGRGGLPGGHAKSRRADRALPGLRRAHLPAHVAAQSGGGEGLSQGFNAERGIAPRRDA